MAITIDTKIMYLERTVKVEDTSVVAINPKSKRVTYHLIIGGVIGLLNYRYGTRDEHYIVAYKWAKKYKVKDN